MNEFLDPCRNGKGLVFLSNSIPKSASTVLANCQRQLIYRAFEKKEKHYPELEEHGLKLTANFLHDPNSDKFLDLLEKDSLSNGPYVLKVHCTISKRLAALLKERQCVFMSFAVRDPLEVFFSARDHFNRNGEFPSFSSLDGGIRTLHKLYESYFSTTQKLTDVMIVVEYKQIVKDLISATVASLPLRLKDMLVARHPNAKGMEGLARDLLDVKSVMESANFRKTLALAERPETRDLISRDPIAVREALAGLRQRMGYI